MADEMTPEEEERIKQEVQNAFHPQGPMLFRQNSLSNIKHAIAIVSGKGGVGKSLVTGLLATELGRRGTKVGILDADITGPSIPRMLGIATKRMAADPSREMMIPVKTAGGIKVVSTNLVLERETDPVLWRGPILMGVLKQFWEQTIWGDIDFLLIDMPPGTGDVALTVFQQAPISGIIIVTSPQDLVHMVVAKALNMAREMAIPVIGLIENMSYVSCPDCGRKIELFGASNIEEQAKKAGLAVLGRLPIDPALAAACDMGQLETKAPTNLLLTAADRIIEVCSPKGASR